MAAMGITESTVIEVISTAPLVVSLEGKLVRIGRGEADKVVVEKVANES